MRKILVGITICLLLVSVSVMAQVEDDGVTIPTEVDNSPSGALIKAQLLAGWDITHYEGRIYYDRPGFPGQRVRGEILFNPQLQAERIEIDGVVLYDDPTNPIYDLPRPSSAVSNLEFHLEGFVGHEEVLFGHYHDSYFNMNDDIHTMMLVNYQRQTVGFDLPAFRDRGEFEMVAETPEGHSVVGYYDESSEEFVVWVDPDWGVLEYRIIDLMTGEAIEVGQISAIDSEQGDGFSVSFEIEDGIEVIDLRPRGVSSKALPRRRFDTVDTLFGNECPAKMFVVKREDDNDIWVHLNDFSGHVRIFEWVPSGEMPEMGFTLETPDSPNYEVSLRIGQGPERLVVVLYGDIGIEEFDAMVAQWHLRGGKG